MILDKENLTLRYWEEVSNIGILFVIMTMLIILLLFKHMELKKQMKSLSRQIMELTCARTEKMLDISLMDRDLEQLATILNQYNAKQRQLVAGALHHEEHLKESIVNISHDLRTPLTVILGHLQLLKRDDLSSEQERRVEIILRKADRMKELVETFYDLSVLEAEQMQPQKERFNLSNLLINLITENAPALEQKKINPTISLPDSSVYLYSDRNMIERILQNLLTNAIRYSDGTIKISLSQATENTIEFQMENSVTNSSDLDPQRLFERFYTGDHSRHSKSTGIGLAVVKLLTERLGGQVKATVNSDQLMVTIRL